MKLISMSETTMLVAKWGNSLAVRIPAHVVRELGIKEGDTVEAAFHRLMSRQEALADLAALSAVVPPDLRVERDRDAP